MRPAEKLAPARRPVARFAIDDDLLFQSHWRRFGVTLIMAALVSALMLAGFAGILISERPMARRTSAIMATLIEPSHPKPVKPKPAPPVSRPKPHKTVARIAPRKPIAPPPPREIHPNNSAPAALAGSTAGGIVTGRATVPDEGETGGLEGVPSIESSESLGARALYAPTPQIPDDLRETVFSALAVAHFVVDSHGHVQVTLLKPTSNPRLNQIILDSLRNWKFLPAVKAGVPIASEFDVRIPIAVN